MIRAALIAAGLAIVLGCVVQLIDYENAHATVVAGESEGVCDYCLPLTVTLQSGDAVGYSANYPIALPYEEQLNNPCWETGTAGCPYPVRSGKLTLGISPTWFVPETAQVNVWADRENGDCLSYGRKGTERPGCHYDGQVRCGPVQTVTLPAQATVACQAQTAHGRRRSRARRGRGAIR